MSFAPLVDNAAIVKTKQKFYGYLSKKELQSRFLGIVMIEV